jgi:hypothetical protein
MGGKKSEWDILFFTPIFWVFLLYLTGIMGKKSPRDMLTLIPQKDCLMCFKDPWLQKTHPFPLPRDFSAPFSLPQNFPLPTYLTSCSFHLHRASRRRETQGLRKVESSKLKECGVEKARGALHPKCKSERER